MTLVVAQWICTEVNLEKEKLIEKENKYKKGKNPLSSIVNVNEIGNVKTC